MTAGRVLVNKQPLRKSKDLLGVLRCSMFSPDDLVLVKGGPGERRQYLDDALVALHPRNDALVTDLDRSSPVFRPRSAPGDAHGSSRPEPPPATPPDARSRLTARPETS